MLALLMSLRLRPERHDSFDVLMRELIACTRREPGTLAYVCHGVSRQPDVRVIYGLFADQEAFDLHESAPHMAAILRRRDAMLDGVPEIEFLDVQDDHSVDTKESALSRQTNERSREGLGRG